MQKTECTQEIFDFDRSYRTSGTIILCGVDEAGRGPLAGPIVASAVIFHEDTFIEGVKDSKKLTPKLREELYSEITAKCLCWSVGICGHKKIDHINIHQANILAMKKALNKLSVKPDLILVDGNFFKHRRYNYINIVKGDEKSFTVAAASIIAKVTRDRIMCRMQKRFPFFDFSAHKGYATKKHVEEIRSHGYCDIHRRSFLAKGLRSIIIEEKEIF